MSVENIFLTKMVPDIVVNLDQNGAPIPVKSETSSPSSAQAPQVHEKVAVQLLAREDYLMDSGSDGKMTVKPVLRRFFSCLTHLGYRVVVVDFRRWQEAADVDSLAEDILDEIRGQMIE